MSKIVNPNEHLGFVDLRLIGTWVRFKSSDFQNGGKNIPIRVTHKEVSPDSEYYIFCTPAELLELSRALNIIALEGQKILNG